MGEQNLETVRRFWDSVSSRDIDAYLATFADGAIAYDPVDGPPLRSSEERRSFMEGLLANFPSLTAKIDFLTPCGDRTAAKWTAHATTSAGDTVCIEGIDVYRHADDGRIVEMWGYFQM